ncbi:PucR family transcriptional regulator [Amycolatopsis sp. WGS_07]|uniref:PucR family transcriptional regulator n=1 Tax=Amycolatopsis sp. WGS_07 TaxID=3076764 RepID=UPI0038739070
MAADASRRQAVLDKVFARRHELAEDLVAEYRREIPEYGELPEPVLVRDVTEAAVLNIEFLVRSLADDAPVADGAHEWLRRSAARRVHQRVSLPSLLRSFRIWGIRLWQAMDKLAGSGKAGRLLSIELAEATMVHVDRVSTAVTSAYVRESAAVPADRTALRTDVLETLLTGEAVSEQARRQSAVLRMTLRGPVLVVVVQLPPGVDSTIGVQSAIRAVRNQLAPLAREFLVGARESEVVAICCLDAAEDVREIEPACDRLADPERGWAVGVGRAAEGLPGVRQSYAEAREAADLGGRTRAVRFGDVLLDRLLRAPGHTDALLEETVQPLLDYDARKGRRSCRRCARTSARTSA